MTTDQVWYLRVPRWYETICLTEGESPQTKADRLFTDRVVEVIVV